jgi:hypothetical protein
MNARMRVLLMEEKKLDSCIIMKTKSTEREPLTTKGRVRVDTITNKS